MVHACKEAGVPFFVHENFRWQAPIRALKTVIDSGEIGTPFRARIQFVFHKPFVFENQPMLKTLEQLALADVGSHLFDLARFFFGDPRVGLLPDAPRAPRHRRRGRGVGGAPLRRRDLQLRHELLLPHRAGAVPADPLLY